MNPLWNYLWPLLACGFIIGLFAGVIGFRRPRIKREDAFAPPPPITDEQRRRRLIAPAAGILACLAATALWHGPIGAADRFSSRVEREARSALDYYEMAKVAAHLRQGPLTRRLILSGPADDFQTSELARLLSQLPGVSGAQWTGSPAGLPLFVEGAAISLLGFLLGLLSAYLFELRRRYNAQWNW